VARGIILHRSLDGVKRTNWGCNNLMSAINANDAKGSMVQAVGCAMRTMKQGPISDFTGCGAHGAPYEP